MNKSIKKNIDFTDYVARIANATPLQLVIINYEIIIDYLNICKSNLNLLDYDCFDKNICKARNFLSELRASLNMSYEISYNLMALYNYIDKLLAFAIFNRKEENIDQAIKFLENLLESWIEIQSKEEDTLPSIDNAHKVYSGMTYNKKGQLDEYIDEDGDRGFRV